MRYINEFGKLLKKTAIRNNKDCKKCSEKTGLFKKQLTNSSFEQAPSVKQSCFGGQVTQALHYCNGEKGARRVFGQWNLENWDVTSAGEEIEVIVDQMRLNLAV